MKLALFGLVNRRFGHVEAALAHVADRSPCRSVEPAVDLTEIGRARDCEFARRRAVPLTSIVRRPGRGRRWSRSGVVARLLRIGSRLESDRNRQELPPAAITKRIREGPLARHEPASATMRQCRRRPADTSPAVIEISSDSSDDPTQCMSGRTRRWSVDRKDDPAASHCARQIAIVRGPQLDRLKKIVKGCLLGGGPKSTGSNRTGTLDRPTRRDERADSGRPCSTVGTPTTTEVMSEIKQRGESRRC